MKKSYLLIILFIVILIVSSFFTYSFTFDNNLRIGEEKYLEFLWMVDGAFNDERFNESFTVNGKKITENIKNFKCIYKDKETCISENFEESFHNLFASNIDYDKVYSDGIHFSWYKKNTNNYSFKNINACSIERMSLIHELKLTDESKDKLVFTVRFPAFTTTMINKDYYFEKEFILIKEDNNWKISKAYYHDLCFTDYYIE